VADALRVLVVTGSRAFDVDANARAWARWAIAHKFSAFCPDVIAHGAARGVDTYADELAAWLGIPRAVFGLSKSTAHLRLPSGMSRPIKNDLRYKFSDPLSRNDALVRWAADQSAEGHVVEVLGLRAPWATTRGTKYTLDRALELDLRIDTPTVTARAWPAEDPAHEGQHGA